MEQKAKLLGTEEFKDLEKNLTLVGVAASEGFVDDRGTLGSGGFTPREDIFNRKDNLSSLCTEAVNQKGQYVVEVSSDQYFSKARELGVKTEMTFNNPNRVFGFVYKSN